MTNFWLKIIPRCKVEVIFKEVRLLRNELRPFSWYDMHSPKCNFACKSKGISNKWSPSKLLWLKNLHFGFMTSRALVWGVRIWKMEIIGRELKSSNQVNSIIVGHLIWICLMSRKNQMSWPNSSFACCQIRPVEMGQKKMQLISIFSLEMDHLVWFCFAWC